MERKGKIISAQTQKGGEGKTFFTKHFAAQLARTGATVVMVETDGQGNLTEGVGLSRRDDFHDLMKTDKPYRELIRPVPSAFTGGDYNLFILSADQMTALVSHEPDTQSRIYAALTRLSTTIDYVLVDTSPSLSEIHAGVFLASDMVVMPAHCEENSLTGITLTLSFFDRVRRAAGVDHHPQTFILPTRYHRRRAEEARIYGVMQGRYGMDNVLMPLFENGEWGKVDVRAEDACLSIFSYHAARLLPFRDSRATLAALRGWLMSVDPMMEALGVWGQTT